MVVGASGSSAKRTGQAGLPVVAVLLPSKVKLAGWRGLATSGESGVLEKRVTSLHLNEGQDISCCESMCLLLCCGVCDVFDVHLQVVNVRAEPFQMAVSCMACPNHFLLAEKDRVVHGPAFGMGKGRDMPVTGSDISICMHTKYVAVLLDAGSTRHASRPHGSG